MLDWLLGQVHNTKHGGPTLRVYLWWGFFVRATLLLALFAFLVVRGNFLSEWLLALNLPFVPRTNVEEFTAISYAVLIVLLSVGAVARWGLIQRLDDAQNPPSESSSYEDEPSGDEEPGSRSM